MFEEVCSHQRVVWLRAASVLCVLALSQGAAASTTYCQVGQGASIDQHPTACAASASGIGGGLNSAQASLATGTLKVLAASSNVPPGQISYADSYASYTETFDILIGAPADAIFRISVHGNVTGEGGASIFLSLDGLGIGAALLGLFMTESQTSFSNNTGFTGAPWANTAPGIWETSAPLIAATSTFVIQMVASATGSNGGVADFGNTFGFDILLPAGATMTSESGVFLTQDGTPAPVPLPPALPLMAGAVAGLGLWRGFGNRRGAMRAV